MNRAMKLSKQLLKKLPEEVDKLHQAYPEAKVELWSQDEHRIGLKPILRRVWAKPRQSCQSSGATRLPVDVSLRLCAAAERKDQLVAYAHDQCHGFFSGALSFRTGTGSGTTQARSARDGSGRMAQES